MKSLSYLNKYFRKYKWHLILGVLFIAIQNFFNSLPPVLIGKAVNSIQHFEDKNHDEQFYAILWLALQYLLYSAIAGFFLFLTRQAIIIMSRLIEFDLKNEIYQKYQALHLTFFKSQRTGDLMNRISEDVGQVRQYLGPGIMYTANLIIMIPFISYQMFSLDVKLALIALTPLPIMTLLIYFVSNRMNRLSKDVQQEQSQLSTISQETFSGMRVIKSYLQEIHAVFRFKKSAEAYRSKQMRLVKTNALFMPTISLIIGSSTILFIFFAGRHVMSHPGNNGIIITFITFIYKLTWPFASVGWVTSIIQRAGASQERINEFLAVEPAIQNEKKFQINHFESLKFDNVSFRYRDDLPNALSNISFELKKGKVLGIIGRTGSGKSSLLQLIMRQTDPSSGAILINNQPLHDADLTEYRNLSAVVPQDVFLFSDTIKNNIQFGAQHTVSQEEIEKAAADAYVLHNINGFEKRFETELGERGVNLSGGQKQRVSIARALIRKPELLILDDCLSAVDTETEEIILNNLGRIQAENNTTMVIVSHRISSIRHADWVLVIEDGQLVEQGTQEDLIAKDGLFKEMVDKQALEDESTRMN